MMKILINDPKWGQYFGHRDVAKVKIEFDSYI